MKISRKECLRKSAEIEALEQTGSFNAKVSNVFLNNQFALDDVLDENKKYTEKITDKFLADKKIKKEEIESFSEERQKNLQDELDLVFEENEEYQKFLDAVVEIEFATFSVKDLRGCTYKSVIMKELKGTILKVPKPTIKATAK